ncbi:MAG TPA: HlyD family efflux transporter periplasmic adaptor subunit [Steroidobacteraceae bacterium]|nr:HlyD family efflux transporter periplasmic adaptor subunit [Steroidobacteraceae bacterium]
MKSAIARRLWFWIPLFAALVAVLAWLFRPQPVAVDLATASRGALRVTVSDEGETRVRDVFVVSAPVPGLMRRIELEAGDQVVADQTIVARIEPSDPSFLDRRSEAEARAAVRAAEAARAHAGAELRRAEAERDFAESELKRYEGLAAANTVSLSDLDAARRRARTAVAAVQEARAGLRVRDSELEQAKARLLAPGTARERSEDCDCVLVRSPVSGRVLRVRHESESVVSSGTPLVDIGDPLRLEIVADLLSTEAVKVEPGQRVLIDSWGGDGALEGVVRRVEPFGFTKVSALGVEEQRVNVIIDFTEPPERWQRLGHGYRVEPRIVLWESDDVLKVPLSSLFRSGERWAVFVARGGRARLTEVGLGHENGLEAEILGGLEEGALVVLHPSDRVSDGERIEQRTYR